MGHRKHCSPLPTNTGTTVGENANIMNMQRKFAQTEGIECRKDDSVRTLR